MIIETQGLTKQYGSHIAVKDIDLHIQEGQLFGLLGANGSGKSTLFKMLATLTKPTKGDAHIAGFDLIKNPVDVRRQIGVVFQDITLDRRLTVKENFLLAGGLFNLKPKVILSRAEALLTRFELQAIFNLKVEALSGGLARFVDLIRSILHCPPILFLDEPTSNLDVKARLNLLNYLHILQQEEGTTVILTTHYLEEALPCDALLFLKKGSAIAEGTPRELIESLGHYVLEISGKNIEKTLQPMRTRFSRFLALNEHYYFFIENKDFQLEHLEIHRDEDISALALRKPTLNDVYLWINTYHDRSDTRANHL